MTREPNEGPASRALRAATAAWDGGGWCDVHQLVYFTHARAAAARLRQSRDDARTDIDGLRIAAACRPASSGAMAAHLQRIHAHGRLAVVAHEQLAEARACRALRR